MGPAEVGKYLRKGSVGKSLFVYGASRQVTQLEENASVPRMAFSVSVPSEPQGQQLQCRAKNLGLLYRM